MNTISDLRRHKIEWSPVADSLLRQMSAGEQRAIRSAMQEIERHFDPSGLTLIEAHYDGEKPFYILGVGEALSVCFERDDGNRFRVVDIIPSRQRDVFRRGADRDTVAAEPVHEPL